jgi:hypothetical protein
VKISIWTEPLPPPFHWNPRAPVRGTEKFYVQTAAWLTRFGHEVEVVYDGAPVTVSGARYLPRATARPGERRLVCNDYSAPGDVFWTNFADFSPERDRCPRRATIVVSRFAQRRAGVEAVVVPHGYDPGVYHPPAPGAERERVCCYTSSPDRGGDLLSRAWPEVERLSGYSLWISTYPGRGGTPPSDAEVAHRLRRSRYWLHPGLGTELFCLSAAEAQACGCVPIVAPHQALHETVRHGFRFCQVDYLNGLVRVLRAFDDHPLHADAEHLLTWEQATRELWRVLLDAWEPGSRLQQRDFTRPGARPS